MGFQVVVDLDPPGVRDMTRSGRRGWMLLWRRAAGATWSMALMPGTCTAACAATAECINRFGWAGPLPTETPPPTAERDGKECIDGSCTCRKCPLRVSFGTRVL